MKLTVLGNNGPYPGSGGACSGYLVEKGNTKILLDCGNGVISRLQRIIGLEALDGIIVTHLHSDHMSDLLVLRYALDIMLSKGMLDAPMKLYAPGNPAEVLKSLQYKNVFDINLISEDTTASLGELEFCFKPMVHPVPTYAVRVSGGDKSIVYSADTSYNSRLVEFGSGCDLFLCECALMEKDRGDNPVHLTAFECGEIAVAASAKRFLVTHLWPGYDSGEVLSEVKARYPDAELSVEMNAYNV